MTRRWFLSSVTIGAAESAKSVTNARPTFEPKVDLVRTVDGRQDGHTLTGPALQMLGPGDTLGFEPSMVVRREPPPGRSDAIEDYLALIEFSDAALPWLFSTPTPVRMPWLTLLVLRAGEGEVRPGNPLPTIDVPAAARPNLAEAASWVHVEARVEGDGPPNDAVKQDVRTGLDTVISRVICPRRLSKGDWIACVVPTTKAGAAAGLNKQIPADGERPAWTSGQGGVVTLPVYDWWAFGVSDGGQFETLARKIKPIVAENVPGLGSRLVNVRTPWPHEVPPAGTPAEVTVAVQGALRLPGPATRKEAWSHRASQDSFLGHITDRVNAPAARRERLGRPPDEGPAAVAPPLYGGNHAGTHRIPVGGWQQSLNTQVRYRVAAAIGARYVQLEQEFLMARAWEQVGAVNEANRLLAATELAEQSGESAQGKHIATMAPAALTGLADVMSAKVPVPMAESMRKALARSAAPGGMESTAFVRLTRPHGGLARRCARAAGTVTSAMATGSMLTTSVGGTEVVPAKPALWLAATTAATSGPMAAAAVARDPASLFAAQTMVGLLGVQQESFAVRGAFTGGAAVAQLAAVGATMSASMAGAAEPVPRAMLLRGLRRSISAEALTEPKAVEFGVRTGIAVLADSVRTAMAPMGKQLERIAGLIGTTALPDRDGADTRPLRPIMAHPEFGFPIAAEILERWPEWAIPGITTFPDNSATLLQINSPFVESLLVGLNQEFNRELRWREYPTDEAGTPFSRFWPPGGAQPQYGEIARWQPEVALGEHVPDLSDLLVLLVRGEVLRRYPGTVVVAAKSVDQRVESPLVRWQHPRFVLPVDERTSLFCFNLKPQQARNEKWMFVVREPMRGTQFGFDPTTRPEYESWSDLGWDRVPQDDHGFVEVRTGGVVASPSSPEPATWPGADSGDFARIVFQRAFQVAFSPNRMLPPQ
ncbi:hypothetical protein [Nocardia pneumoniae]|uniref:hypothetical protein n=1 Tax=Nocardia pneumoniae TaxID=228601 RepID=UPI0002E9D28A|nr:hypothetical protein [Nocardia pneumoniae]